MSFSPPASPPPVRPMSGILQTGRSSSRMSVGSKLGPASRASDEEGKTSVKVAVRIRPPLRSSDPGFELIPQRFQRSTVHSTSPTSLAVDSAQGRKLFVFDRVFGEDVRQDGVWEYVSDSVNSFVQGYNVSILAYGQSGSGKSYTMGTSGPTEQNDAQLMGVIPRAAKTLFAKLAGRVPLQRSTSSGLRTPTRFSIASAQGLAALAKVGDENWQMKATYVEIYNEQLRDLLIPESVPASERAPVTIREDTKGRILLTGLRQVSINSIDDLLGALNFGSSIRQTDATAINAQSSRSHAVFSINLIQKKTKAGPTGRDKRMSMPLEAMLGAEETVTMDSKLHFVDLAGSERLKNTGASGDRAKEGISINAGLASLGKVISQLSTRHSGTHISYRDSKLTRLLQDSLGGNAITYMIACVTPAEFHLSETLNTVQYAQRARAIQSRPQLQQVSDDSDRQAIIERLRAEISFLRDQIHNSERGVQAPTERPDRQNEREMELQNHLLDIQENYTALSQRHAKLISEITRARDNEPGDTPTLSETIGESAIDRLKRSNSFAEAVEKVVLEYEKTIQSLETSLSNTRSSLSTTESSLMERENKCAYADTLNQQLQHRIQKLVDRENSNEQYLHTLEARLDGQTSGDEKSTALVVELRKELSRIRENEIQAEDYISTLEERLAEADQDLDLKQRELDRLEHVVERQRSLGKLDNLLYEFDHARQGTEDRDAASSKPLINGVGQKRLRPLQSEAILEEAAHTALPESDDEGEHMAPGVQKQASGQQESSDVKTGVTKVRARAKSLRFSEDSDTTGEARQLEQVTKELSDLRMRHESTVGEFDIMTAKYEEALRTLAELQDAVDISRHPEHTQYPHSPLSPQRTSFIGDARVNEIKDGEQPPSSRSLSSELSLAGDSSTSVEPSSDEISHSKVPHTDHGLQHSGALRELDELKRSKLEQDRELAAANEKYSMLHELHAETLDIVEELKTEVQKAKLNNVASTSSPVIRRKSSQNVMTIDRAHRSFASLRNIAAENLEDRPDTMQSFELNLNTAMHELHQRSERVQLLEAELAAVKKDMENKTQMIHGLTRERSSLKQSSPIMDMSVMSTLNDQLLQREAQMRHLQERHDSREHQLHIEIDSLKRSLDDIETTRSRVSSDNERELEKQNQQQSDESIRLQAELASWQTRYQSKVDSMETTEKRLLSTITELESTLQAVENMKDQAEEKADKSVRRSVADADFEAERQHHIGTVNSLQQEINEHKTTIGSYVDRIASLEQFQSSAQAQNEDAERTRSANEGLLESHRNKISELEQQIQEHQSAVDFHKHGLKSLHDSHSREVENLRSQIDEHEGARGEMERNMRTMQDAHAGHLGRLESEVIDFKAQLEKSRAESAEQLHHSKSAVAEAERQRDQLQAQISTIKSEMNKAARLNEANLKKMDDMKRERDRATSLVDQLEEQLNESYEKQRASTTRQSLLNNGPGAQAMFEEKTNLERQLRESQSQIESLQGQLRDSQQSLERSPSNLRKSASITSLPSPPPAIPLPPLPANAIASPTSATFPPNPPGSPPPHINGATSATAAPTGPAGATGPNPPPTSDPKLQKELDNLSAALSDRENHMRQMEKHLIAEKQLTRTLEEALADLEAGQKRQRVDVDAWKQKCWRLEDEVGVLRKDVKEAREEVATAGAGREKERERERERWSIQAVEEEKRKRSEAERARAELEERMKGLERGAGGAGVGGKKKRKGGGLNCF